MYMILSTSIKSTLGLSQVGCGVPEKVTKRHLYSMEGMYIYIAKTRDSNAVHVA